mmetsp:Transcript_53036/g.138220  ORF Transcript_53036/g.138220 Transcript_53036/m.138220 type:complete len:274 (-) Transcript_53036:148-969(-)
MHLGAFVRTMDGSAVLSCVSNHQSTQLAVPSSAPSKSSSRRVGMSSTSATPSSRSSISMGLVRILKSPSPLSKSTVSQSEEPIRSRGQKGQNASMLTPFRSGSLTSQSTPKSFSLAGMTGAPGTHNRLRALRVSCTRFSPSPDASMSSLTSTLNFMSSGGSLTPRTSVHQMSNGADSRAGMGASESSFAGRFAATTSSETRAMAVTTSTPTAADAPARSAIMERMPSPLPTSSTRHLPMACFTLAISACSAASYRSCRAESRSISKYHSESAA